MSSTERKGDRPWHFFGINGALIYWAPGSPPIAIALGVVLFFLSSNLIVRTVSVILLVVGIVLLCLEIMTKHLRPRN